MAHTFLIEAGVWQIRGRWFEEDRAYRVIGKATIAWQPQDWFTRIDQLVLLEGETPTRQLTYQYRGRLSDDQCQYNFVLDRGSHQSAEGEGRLGETAILECHWPIGDRERRGGFATLYCLDERTYHASSATVKGLHLESTFEAIFSRAR